MWVEVDHDKVATAFNKHDKIRVEVDNGCDYEGLFLKYERTGPYIHLTQPGSDYPVCLYVWPGRKFYHWADNIPVGGPDVDQSKIRLHNPERAKKLHAHIGEIIAEQKMAREVEDKQVPEIMIGDVVVDLRPGHHLRVWWEGNRLHTEIVQGVEQ